MPHGLAGSLEKQYFRLKARTVKMGNMGVPGRRWKKVVLPS